MLLSRVSSVAAIVPILVACLVAFNYKLAIIMAFIFIEHFRQEPDLAAASDPSTPTSQFTATIFVSVLMAGPGPDQHKQSLFVIRHGMTS